MVFFTCNSCGQSVKKAQVEKHYLTECRSCEVLSCMDCGQDFAGDDYKHHTKCVSENEKYGGKGYNAKPNKGEVKQSQWIQCVQAASSSKSVSPRVRGLLNRLANFNNIPRKKAKFQKFVQNSLKVWDASLIEQIWDVFSEAGYKQKTPTEQQSTDEAGKQDTTGPAKESDLGQRDTRGSVSAKRNGESSKEQLDECGERDTKKKKKIAKDLGDQQELEGGIVEETSVTLDRGADGEGGEEGDTDSPKKKKKNKKRDKEKQAAREDLSDEMKAGGLSDADGTDIGGGQLSERRPSAKKGKKKRKRCSAPEAEDVTETTDKEGQMGTEEESNGSRKDKKRKQKKGHLKDQGDTIGEGVSSDAADDVRLTTAERKVKKGPDQVNGDGEKRQRKRGSVGVGVGDETGEGHVDRLASPSGKKKRKRQTDEHTGYHKDGLLLVSDNKRKTKKRGDNSLDRIDADADKSMTESNVDKSEVGAVDISKKMKKTKAKHTEGSPGGNNDDAETLGTKKSHKKKDENFHLEESDPADQTERKKKKKKRKLNSTSDENGVQPKAQDEEGNFEQKSPSSKTKRPQKRKSEVDSADDFQSPIKRKKQTKVGHENRQTAQEESHTTKYP